MDPASLLDERRRVRGSLAIEDAVGRRDDGSRVRCQLTALFSIGAFNNSALPFEGLIDDVQVYDRAITSADVARLSPVRSPQGPGH